MSEKKDPLAELRVEGLAEGALSVVEFTGRDALSEPYAFTLLAASSEPGLTAGRMIRKAATVTISSAQWQNAYSGVIFSFRKMGAVDERSFYALQLVPRLRLLELTRHNQVFLDMTLPQILESVFKECGVELYDLRLTRDYPKMEYVCQYGETHFNFISRWMEHLGLYYFFEETPAGEKVVITDAKIAHSPLADAPFPYRQASGLDELEEPHAVFSLTLEERIVPQTLMLKDYNYLRPDLNLYVETGVDPEGVGKTYHYGDHFETMEEGEFLAKVRAQELLSGKRVFQGASGCLPCRAGGLAAISGHPDPEFNLSCLVTEVEHRGRPSGPLTSGLGGDAAPQLESGYQNRYAAIPADVQYRPLRRAEKTRLPGVVNAMIDAESSGQYAELDQYGRYKVRLPFDLANRPDGHASCWLRMAEPYAGAQYGAHFPLHKGVEVLLAFVNADPDRPVIAAAVHNGENRNPINNENSAISAIKSAGNNQLLMNDAKGQEAMAMWSPFHNSGIAIGSLKEGGGGSILTQTEGENETLVKGAMNTMVLGECGQVVGGLTNYVYAGALTNVVAGMGLNFNLGANFTFTKGYAISLGESASDFKTDIKQIGQKSITLAANVTNPHNAALEEAKKALKFAVGGVALASAGTILATEGISKEGVLGSKGKDWRISGGCVGGAMALAGVPALGYAGYLGKKASADFEAAAQNMVSAKMTLDGNGVNITADNAVSPLAQFSATVSDAPAPAVEGEEAPAAPDASSITIAPHGQSITLKNMDEATITLSDGQFITIGIGPSEEPVAAIRLKEGEISLLIGGTEIDIMEEGITVVSGDSVIAVKENSISLTNSSGSFSLADGSISMKSVQWKVNEGALKVDEAGMVTLG